MIWNEEQALKDIELVDAVENNRVSALSLAMMTSTQRTFTEKQLYTQLLNLTKYKSRGLRLIDYEDTDVVVGN